MIHDHEPNSNRTPYLGVVVDEGVAHFVDDSGRGLTLQAESGLDDRDFRSSGVETGESAPIVDDETGADHIGSSVNGTSDEGDLEQ